jgi:C1A family cysteine protease
LTFGEAFQHKHIIEFDLEDGSREYIRNKFSPQHFIIPEKDVDKYDITKNFIRIAVDDISSSTVVELKKGLEGQKPATLEIMPVKHEDEAHIIDDAKAILDDEDKMLEKYIEAVFKQSSDTSLDKEKLLEVGKQICQTPVDS